MSLPFRRSCSINLRWVSASQFEKLRKKSRAELGATERYTNTEGLQTATNFHVGDEMSSPLAKAWAMPRYMLLIFDRDASIRIIILHPLSDVQNAAKNRTEAIDDYIQTMITNSSSKRPKTGRIKGPTKVTEIFDIITRTLLLTSGFEAAPRPSSAFPTLSISPTL